VLCRRAWPDDANGTSCWVIEDVSHAREVERELLRAGRDLSEANRELAAAHEHLRSERAEREELLLVVSHELRTPLTVIGGYVRLLLSEEVGPLTEEQRRFLEESQKSAKRLSGFIGNILDAKRAAKGDEVLEVGPAPVAPVVEAVASMFERLVSEREIDLHLELDPSLRACFDATRVEQILTNLLGNAIRFVPRGGSIEISLALCAVRGREFIEVAVADDGPGVAHEDRERIFEPYVQGGEEGHRGGLRRTAAASD
jgi:signal transduction histidine kinase